MSKYLVFYNTRNISIPRCSDCSSVHYLRFLSIIKSTLIGSILLAVFLYVLGHFIAPTWFTFNDGKTYVMRSYLGPEWIILGGAIVIGAFVGILVGAFIFSDKISPDVKYEKDNKDYYEVKLALADGYEFGEKPK